MKVSFRTRASNASVVAIALSASFATPAIAQDEQASGSSDQGLREIIVTAQRREQNLQDVPISIAAADQETLESSGVENLKDIGFISSGVSVTDSNAYVFPTIRGIGTFVQGSSSFSSVAIYLDGVYMPRTTSAAFELTNIKSVEILKGPQSTLYGRNATGGALNITTRTTRPGDPLSADVEVSYGEYDAKKVNGYVETGLGDVLAVNIAGYYIDRDGYVDNLANLNRDITLNADSSGVPFVPETSEGLDSRHEYGAQIKLTIEPSDNLKLTLSARGSKYHDTASANARQLNPVAANLALQAISAAFGGIFGPGPFTFATEYGTSYGHSNRRRGYDYGFTGNIVAELGRAELTSITSLNRTELETSVDLLSASIPTLGFAGAQPSKYLFHETRVRTDLGGPIDFLVGINYFSDKTAGQDVVLRSIIGGFPIIGQVASIDSDATAGFAEAYFKVTDRLTLTGGMRYTDETVRNTEILDSLGNVPAGAKFKEKFNKITWRAVADYKTGFGLIYGSVSTGFKSGGLNPNNLASGGFDPEEIVAYEFGIKGELFDDRLRLNGAGFYYDFKGIQASITGGPTGGAQFLVNGDNAKVSGIEGDFEFKVGRSTRVFGGATYLIDREYQDFLIPANAITVTPELDATGNKLVGAPQFSAVLGLSHMQDLGGAGSVDFSVNLSYNSGYFHSPVNDIGTGGLNSDSGYTLVNSRVKYNLPGENVYVTVFARNLFDEKYTRAGLSALGGATVFGLDANPQEFGASFGFSF